MMEDAFTKRRLLDAIEYIDDKYIASAARYKMKIKPYSSEPPVQTVGGSLKKYWKQYLGLVACLLIVALASPLFILVAQNITSLLAGSSIGRQEDVPYLQFSPDLEPISKELVEEINEKFFDYYFNYEYTLEDFYRDEGEKAEDRFNIHHRVIRNYDVSSPYLGTIGDYVIFIAFANTIMTLENEIAGYTFETHTYVYDTENKSLCQLKEAYEQGLLSKSDILLLSNRRREFYEFSKENEDLPRRITEEQYYEKKNLNNKGD